MPEFQPMNILEIKTWLDEIDRDRNWLADELGVSKRTVDNWFSAKEFPLSAIKHIDRIRASERSPKLRFTPEEFDTIEAARKLAGYDSRDEFYAAVLSDHAKRLLENPSR